ncbi:MAG: BLUF domain-containing protein [Actinomycetota bacterium]
MTAELWRLVYISRNDITGPAAVVRAEIDGILETARSRNAALGVTGALMFNTERFAQVLEGERTAVTTIYEAIQTDLRHSEVRLLTFEPVEERAFPTWAMAYVGDNDSAAEFIDIAVSSGFDHDGLGDDGCFGLIREHLADSLS